MIIKTADSRESDIAALEELLRHPDATAQNKKDIDKEIRCIRSGLRGELSAAYEIDFYWRDSENVAVLHDLRIEHNGLVAQIDHLLINRFLDIDVCESKRFSEGISFNDQGECCYFYQSKPKAIASPIEQNKKHLFLLDQLLKSKRVFLPTRLGFPITPALTSYVLIANNSRLTRPKNLKAAPGIESVMKVDQFRTKRNENMDKDAKLTKLARIVSTETVEKFARQLAALHRPAKFNWAAKFGLAPLALAQQEEPALSPLSPRPRPARSQPQPDLAVAVAERPVAAPAPRKEKSKLICACCGSDVPLNVARFCWFNKPRFKEQVVCQPCQPQFQ